MSCITTPKKDGRQSISVKPNFLTPSKLQYKPPESFDIFQYLRIEFFGEDELTCGELLPENDPILNFVRVPYQLESLILLGWVMSLDAFLYILTFFPLRVIFAATSLINEFQLKLASWVFGGDKWGQPKLFYTLPRFRRTQLYDLMRGVMAVMAVLVLWQINMGQVYHFIRGQNIIKLYVLAAMMEVMDKLFSSFGQDAFDALHTQTKYNPTSINLCKYFALTSVYVILHSILYFFEVATYTVVVNSSDEALLTVLVLNNFAELKSFVFKKFDQNHLFQLSCSDITERFQLVLFLFTILIVTAAQNDFQWKEIIPAFLRIFTFMLIGESVADCIKHAFINKFNSFNAELYKDFAFVLRLDILNCHNSQGILDRTYAITKRFGMSQIPLGCVFVRYLMLAVSSSSLQYRFVAQTPAAVVLILLFVLLLTSKIIIGVSLVAYADYAQRRAMQQFENKPAADRSTSSSDSKVSLKKMEMVEELMTIDRYTVHKGRVIN